MTDQRREKPRAPHGQRGAIDFFGRSAGLLPALSGDRTYFFWGARGYSGACMIVLDHKKEVLERYWESVEYVGSSAPNPWAHFVQSSLHASAPAIRPAMTKK